MGLTSFLARAFAQLQMVGHHAGQDAQVAHRRIVERGNEPVHAPGKAPHHPLFKRYSASERGIETIRIYEAVSHVLGGVAAGAGVYPVRGGLARKAPGILVSQEKHVVAVLGGPDEVAVFAKIMHVVRGPEALPAGLERHMAAKYRKVRTEMHPKHEDGDPCRCDKRVTQRQGSPNPPSSRSVHQETLLIRIIKTAPSRPAPSCGAGHSPCPQPFRYRLTRQTSKPSSPPRYFRGRPGRIGPIRAIWRGSYVSLPREGEAAPRRQPARSAHRY